MNLVHAPFYQGYVDLVESDIKNVLEHQASEISVMINNIPDQKWNYRYEKGKWSVAQVIQHCIDTERIMAYRALTLSRGETKALAGFSENLYAEASEYCKLDKSKMAEGFYYLRKSHQSLFLSMPDKILKKEGVADGNPISILSLWYIIVGHWKHHQKVLKDRYF
ncbi:DinB family protein [uncultured Marivirga sp.]|uniref:DinB family protein n=1 Tax=uncultured Marivirga sp. TaxID=1123707 RepID=UPI0030EC3606|tara:strand:- start:224869 stop:225363 length:495 start_codon:yes stop_codon:yes gene_type:complete